MKQIDVNKLKSEMYHNAFEIDTDLQKWDNGCWIRYKLFENVIEEQPTVEAIPVEWIKDYIHRHTQYTTMAYVYPYQVESMLEEWRKENETNQ